MELEATIKMRLDICIPHIVTAFATALQLQLDENKDPLFFKRIHICGLLVQFESLLSTHGPEAGMLGDMDVAVKLLKEFKLVFVPKNSLTPMNPQISFANSPTSPREKIRVNLELPPFPQFLIEWQIENFDDLPQPLKDGEPVIIKPVLFTQGINEQQTMAIRLGETKLQETINQENYPLLADYMIHWLSFESENNSNLDLTKHIAKLEEIGNIIDISKSEKNVEILPYTADFVREIGGIRLTSCKSAKDRTSMSVTWEQARFLNKTYVKNNSLNFIFLFLLFL